MNTAERSAAWVVSTQDQPSIDMGPPDQSVPHNIIHRDLSHYNNQETHIINDTNTSSDRIPEELRKYIASLKNQNVDLWRRSQRLQRKMGRGAFTLVLIDGDAMVFADDLVARGIQGGEEAAQRLLKAVFKQFEDHDQFDHDEKIVIKIYANLRGLAHTYVANGIVGSEDVVRDFVCGFNKVNECCDWIDAGNAKEGADRKLQAHLDLNLYNVHCKRIILGASTDNSYASYLKSFYDIDVPSRVWLLRSWLIAKEFETIQHKYRWINLLDVFRSEPLPHKPHSPRSQALVPSAEGKRKADGMDEDWRQRKQQNPAASPTGSPSRVVFALDKSPEGLEVATVLIKATVEMVERGGSTWNTGHVKQLAVEKLGQNHWFKNVRDKRDPWYQWSNRIVMWAAEQWIERTNAQCNVEWLMGRPSKTPGEEVWEHIMQKELIAAGTEGTAVY